MAISAGKLIQIIVIQNPVHIRDASGQPVETWVDGETIRADIRGRSGRELMAAGAEIARADVRVWVRGKSGETITAASVIKVQSGPYRGKTLNVIGPPIPDEKGERLEILCKLGLKMIETSPDFSGLNDIAKDLEALSRAENNKVLRDATRAGAEVLKEEVIARAPVRTGKLKNVVVVTQSRRRGKFLPASIFVALTCAPATAITR